MFENKPENVVDIFADTEKPGAPGRASGVGQVPNAPVPPAVSHGPSVLLLGGVVLVVLGLGGAGVWYFMLREPAAPVVQPVAQPEVPEPVVSQVAAPAAIPTPEPAPVNTDVPTEPEPTEPTPVEVPAVQPTAPPLDSDGDGLNDDEEAALGTDPMVTDTDNDGLTDIEEVRAYGTDPIDPDTDDDTFPDGSEVKNGYNPRGPGKLFGIPAR